MIGRGYNGSCHTKSGHMLVNTTRFPSFNNMTHTAHTLGQYLPASSGAFRGPCDAHATALALALGQHVPVLLSEAHESP